MPTSMRLAARLEGLDDQHAAAAARATLLRAGELRAIWVPDTVHRTVQDLTRAREVAMIDLKKG